MDRPLISVIVPVYNVEKYISQCIDSILAQTYENLEIILVDDGSVDHSGKICEDYANKDSRIKTIHKQNEGPAEARNYGIRAAAGEYYSFVDSDDRIAADCIEYLYDMASKNDAQISICGYQKVYEIGKDRIPNKNKNGTSVKVCNTGEALEALLYQRGIIASPWGRLLKRELFSSICFPRGKFHEDVAVMYRLFAQAQTIAIGNEKKYYYFQRADSIINSSFDSRRMDYIYFTQECIEYIKDKYPDLEKAAVSRHFSACFELLASIGKDKEDYMEEYGELARQIKKYRKTVIFDSRARAMNRAAAMGAFVSIAVMQKLCCVIRRP